MRKVRGFLVAALALVGSVGLYRYVESCIGSLYDSVHYNDARPDFGAPPSRTVITSWSEEPSRPVPGSTGWNEYETEEQYRETEARITKLRDDASNAFLAENYDRAATSLVALLREDSDKIEDAVFLRDQLEVARLAAKRKLPAKTIAAYFDARKDPRGEAKLRAIENDASNDFLRAFAAYGIAGLKYDTGQYDQAAKLYEDVAAKYQASPLRESALIMVARTRLRGVEANGKWTISAENAAAGKKAIAELRKDFPNSRFLGNAYDWETRTIYLGGSDADAFLRYLKQLDRSANHTDRVNALASLRQVKDRLKGDKADQVRAGLLKDPILLQPYLEFRLYHEDTEKSLDSLAKLAKDVLDKKPNTEVSVGVLARLAEISYLKGDYKTAEKWASDSLKTDKNQPESRRDLATLVLAGAQFKDGRLEESAKNYRKVIDEFEKSYLVGAARENLALIHERKGEWGSALDQYRALNYRFDVATLVDVRMSVNDLQKYIASHPGDKELDEFKFALGLRYLRKDNFDEAERWLKEVPDDRRKVLSQAGSRDYSWQREDDGKIDLLADPLDTLKDLRDLKAKVAAAKTPEEKAAGQYALASYWYERRNLLLYNPALWGGGRSVLAYFWDAGTDRQGYERAIEEHHYEHECLWKARKVSIALATEYPKTASAPKALYRAACAARRLADFNPYWRAPKMNKSLWAECVTLMERVAKEYPNDALAKDAAKYAKVFKSEGEEMSRGAMFAVKAAR